MPLTTREAIELIRNNGEVFYRHGSNHDIFLSSDGRKIYVPRHPGDLSLGVERDIKKKLGLSK